MQNSSRIKNLRRLVLIICTRNREEYMKGLLENLDKCSSIPSRILIIDSSDDRRTQMLVEKSDYSWSQNIEYVRSKSGLPFQRNVGISRIILDNFTGADIVCFTDDDCRLELKYFENVVLEFDHLENCVGVTGISKQIIHNDSSLLRRIFILDSRKQGKILKSGLTTAPFASGVTVEADWMPGGSMNISIQALELVKFDADLRMYGEDLKMSLGLNSIGKLFVSSNLIYSHLNAEDGKDSIRDVVSFSNGARWHLAEVFPKKIKKFWIVWSIAGSITFQLLSLLFLRNKEIRTQILRGNLDFFLRIMKRGEYIQKNQIKS